MSHSVYIVDEFGNAINAEHPLSVTVDKITRVLAFSTTTPLAGAGVYTSPTIDSINYKAAVGLILTDQTGSYFVQYSDDGSAWTNSTAAAATVTASTPLAISITMLTKYFRFVYTNGATLQGSFRFSVTMSPL